MGKKVKKVKKRKDITTKTNNEPPVVEEKAPVVEEKAPVVEEKAPVVESPVTSTPEPTTEENVDTMFSTLNSNLLEAQLFFKKMTTDVKKLQRLHSQRLKEAGKRKRRKTAPAPAPTSEAVTA